MDFLRRNPHHHLLHGNIIRSYHHRSWMTSALCLIRNHDVWIWRLGNSTKLEFNTSQRFKVVSRSLIQMIGPHRGLDSFILSVLQLEQIFGRSQTSHHMRIVAVTELIVHQLNLRRMVKKNPIKMDNFQPVPGIPTGTLSPPTH